MSNPTMQDVIKAMNESYAEGFAAGLAKGLEMAAAVCSDRVLRHFAKNHHCDECDDAIRAMLQPQE